jgi:hypothetical protein
VSVRPSYAALPNKKKYLPLGHPNKKKYLSLSLACSPQPLLRFLRPMALACLRNTKLHRCNLAPARPCSIANVHHLLPGVDMGLSYWGRGPRHYPKSFWYPFKFLTQSESTWPNISALSGPACSSGLLPANACSAL